MTTKAQLAAASNATLAGLLRALTFDAVPTEALILEEAAARLDDMANEDEFGPVTEAELDAARTTLSFDVFVRYVDPSLGLANSTLAGGFDETAG